MGKYLMKYNGIKYILCLFLLISTCIFVCACNAESSGNNGEVNVTETSGGSEELPLRDNTPEVLMPVADGVIVFETQEVCVDASNAEDGYIMVRYKGSVSKVRLLLETPTGATYNYRLNTDGEYNVFPMSDGNGTYGINVYENVTDDQYAEVFSESIDVTLLDETKVFLYPNQYVNFDINCEAVACGAEIVKNAHTDLEAVQAVYAYVTTNVTYDYEKAQTVQSGYLPVVDETLRTGKGICFDYACLMASMLRSQRIPTRLEIGYAGEQYHAWISVYIEEVGWLDDYIVFDGASWVLMDPTLVSTAKAETIRENMDNAATYYEMMYKY